MFFMLLILYLWITDFASRYGKLWITDIVSRYSRYFARFGSLLSPGNGDSVPVPFLWSFILLLFPGKGL